MKLIVLSQVALVFSQGTTTQCAKQCGGANDLSCLAKCLKLPNPSPDQATATLDCNAQCTLSGDDPNKCFADCVNSIYSNNDLSSASLVASSSTQASTSTTSTSATPITSSTTSSSGTISSTTSSSLPSSSSSPAAKSSAISKSSYSSVANGNINNLNDATLAAPLSSFITAIAFYLAIV